MRVITNNVPRRLHLVAALPPKVRKDFDYVSIDDDMLRMVQYRGVWYDVLDSERTGGLPADNPLRAWDGLQGESHFSGVVFRYEVSHVVCGRYVV